jgi:hypothetical protein
MPGANPSLGSTPGRVTALPRQPANPNVSSEVVGTGAARPYDGNPLSPSGHPWETVTHGTLVGNNNTAAERKTSPPSDTPQTPSSNNIEKFGDKVNKNILNSYRSVTYNFTLAALTPAQVNDPATYMTNPDNLSNVILRSGGKGGQGMGTPGGDTGPKTHLSSINSEAIQGFNEYSPGKFDMFIENLEIGNTFAFEHRSGMTLPTNFSFDVIEPYSINGFLEGLQVAAQSAGYSSYMSASFVLVMEFIGYPDGPGMPDAEVIDQSLRYFPILVTGMSVNITERGTVYKVTAVPHGERLFNNELNSLKSNMAAVGNTVKEQVEDLISQINIKIKLDIEKTKIESGQFDEYEVRFPEYNSDGSVGSSSNKIAGAKIVSNPGKEEVVPKHEDVGKTTMPNNYKAQILGSSAASPTNAAAAKSTQNSGSSIITPITQFQPGSRIDAAIEAIIKNSEYVRDIVTGPPKVDEHDMVTYFIVRSEITNKGEEINPEKMQPYQKYTFIITPYKVHYTAIPGYGRQRVDSEKIKNICLRGYDYIYTGENVDIIDFKIDFNTLFFEAMPTSLANSDKVNRQNAAANDNRADFARKDPRRTDLIGDPSDPAGKAPRYETSDANSVNPGKNITAGAPNVGDAYWQMAKVMHEAIVNSNSGMITGEITITGDPYYLVSGGKGNYTPAKMHTQGVETDNGEATPHGGQILIYIKFYNPIDIQSDGFMKFEPRLVPFSGVFFVTEVVNNFKAGLFTQTLKIVRVPGQLMDSTRQADPTDKQFGSYAKPEDQVNADSSPAADSTVVNSNDGTLGDRASTANLLEQQGRSLPSPGSPGQLSNFTNATGGLGGAPQTSVAGATSNAINPTGAGSLVNGSTINGINQLASGIRMQASGLVNAQNSLLTSVATIAAAASVIKSAYSIAHPTQTLATRASSINPTVSSSLDTRAIAAISAPGIAAGKIVSNIDNNITSKLYGISSDINAVGAKFGVKMAEISGLSDKLSSKLVSELNGLTSKIPKNLNVSDAIKQGILLDQLSVNGLKNLPPIAPHIAASAALSGFTGGNPVTNAALVNRVIPTSLTNAVDSAVNSGKLLSANTLVSNVTGVVGSVENKLTVVRNIAGTSINNGGSLSSSVVSKFGSISNNDSPLSKIMSG